MKILPRPELHNLPPVAHGALNYAELEQLGMEPGAVLDFSVNSNPYGPPPGVAAALAKVDLSWYPDREALALRRALAAHLQVDAARLLVGSGVAELLWLLALAYVRPGDRALILGPTFGEYENVIRMMGGVVAQVPAAAEQDFTHNPDQIADRLQTGSYRLVFVCNPNNPTGQALPLPLLDGWARRFPHTLFVLDEAYIAFAPGMETAVALPHPNILVLRSMTKDYALAGLRLGYAVAPPPVIDALARVQPPWSVNGMAQAAGVAALGAQPWLQDSLAKLQRDKRALVSGFRELGLRPLPSATHFFLLPVPDAAAVRRELLGQGVQVRDCASFGLPAYVRIATRKPGENGRLLAAMKTIRFSG